MRRRAILTLVVAVALASVDLWQKAATPAPDWAYHQRSGAWVALSLALLGAAAALDRVPSSAVAVCAGVLAGGVLGNLVSGALHAWAVPDPIVIAVGRDVAAFNLADVFVLTGILSLIVALAATAVRHRDSLRPPRGWERQLRRRG